MAPTTRPIDTTREYMTAKDVAAYLTVGESSVWRWLKAGNLPQPVRICGATRWRRADIEAAFNKSA